MSALNKLIMKKLPTKTADVFCTDIFGTVVETSYHILLNGAHEFVEKTTCSMFNVQCSSKTKTTTKIVWSDEDGISKSNE